MIGINSGDCILVRTTLGDEKLYISSIQVPKFYVGHQVTVEEYGYEARAWLREVLFNKEVDYQVDYEREMDGNIRKCCTIMLNHKNIAVQYVASGLAKPVRHSLKDQHKSPFYDEILSAAAQAETECLGQFSRASAPQYKVVDFGNLRPDEVKTRAARF